MNFQVNNEDLLCYWETKQCTDTKTKPTAISSALQWGKRLLF